ncbi:MAG: prolyl oligopeptidase family serine peptidase, partial [Pirellulaceae bacterium]
MTVQRATPQEVDVPRTATGRPGAPISRLPEATPPADAAWSRWERRLYRAGDAGLPYRLLCPTPGVPGDPWPLVIFLHGAGERGNDNEKQLVHGMSDLASDDVRWRFPAFVVAPQCPADEQWVDTPWTEPSHTMPEQPSLAMRLTLDLIQYLCDELPVDRRRLYVTGLSMGGFGVWDALQRHSDWFAAAAPVCGGGDVALASRIKDVPVWIFHGDEDPVVLPQRSRDMVAALQAAGGRPRYTEYSRT